MAVKGIFECKDCGYNFPAISGSLIMGKEIRCPICDARKMIGWKDDTISCPHCGVKMDERLLPKCPLCGSRDTFGKEPLIHMD